MGLPGKPPAAPGKRACGRGRKNRAERFPADEGQNGREQKPAACQMPGGEAGKRRTARRGRSGRRCFGKDFLGRIKKGGLHFGFPGMQAAPIVFSAAPEEGRGFAPVREAAEHPTPSGGGGRGECLFSLRGAGDQRLPALRRSRMTEPRRLAAARTVYPATGALSPVLGEVLPTDMGTAAAPVSVTV